MVFIGGMSANIQQVESPSHCLRGLAAPLSEIALPLVMIAVATFVRRSGLFAASAFVKGMMMFDPLALSDGFFADVAGHISMPPIRKPRSHLKCEQEICLQVPL